MPRIHLRPALCLCAMFFLVAGAWQSDAVAQPGATGPRFTPPIALRTIPLARGARIPLQALRQGPAALLFGRGLTLQTAKRLPIFSIERLPTRIGEAASLACKLHRLDVLKVRLRDGKLYDRLLPAGLTASAPVGHPEQFSAEQLVRIPNGARPIIVVDQANWQQLPQPLDLAPVQMPEPDTAWDGPLPPPRPFRKDPVAYGRPQPWPASPVQLRGTVRIRGEEFAVVGFTPVAYNPTTKLARLATEVKWRMTFAPVPGVPMPAPPAGPAKRPVVGKRPPLDVRPLQFQVLPMIQFRRFWRVAMPWQADYLIITADKYVDEIAPLVTWKTQKGFDVFVARLSQVGTTSAHIKQYISNVYHRGGRKLQYVLLVGDMQNLTTPADSLPGVRLVGHPDPFHGSAHVWHTDHDYACVDGTDMYADVTLGRLPGDTEAQITTMVNNILRYEKTPVPGNWYGTALLSAQYQSHGGTRAERWFMETTHRLADFLGPDYDFFGSWNGYAGTDPFNKGYTILTALDWDTNPASATNLYYRTKDYPWRLTPPSPLPTRWKNMGVGAAAQITSAINAGVGLVIHRDHGYCPSGSGWSNPHFTTPSVTALANGNRQPVVFSLNCGTGWMDNKNAFGEEWVRKPSGGAVGYVGAIRVSWSGPNDIFCIGVMDTFWDDYTTNDDGAAAVSAYPNSWRPAQAVFRGKAAVLSALGTGDAGAIATARMYNWCGDPEMMLRTQNPYAILATWQVLRIPLPGGASVNVVKVIARRGPPFPIPINGAKVCIRATDAPTTAYAQAGTAKSGPQGDAYVVLSPVPDKMYTITVTERNGYPFQRNVILVSSQPTVTPVRTTSCPMLQTGCPMSWTTCPPQPTYCPTRCTPQVVQPTVSPARQTQCPMQQTLCPTCEAIPMVTMRPVMTQCPSRRTQCPRCTMPFVTVVGKATTCPRVKTHCPRTSTQCPTRRTICPRCEITPRLTMRPKWTQCPAIRTKCPPCYVPRVTIVARQTACPLVKTICPASKTKCPQSRTICPRCAITPRLTMKPKLTQCPLRRTKCPMCYVPRVTIVARQTACPLVKTKCPASKTKCPQRYTVCPRCMITPRLTTMPKSTQCPVCYVPRVTVVARQTACPLVKTKCPMSKTQCPASRTHCPRDRTRCPLCITTPMLTAVPSTTICPTSPTKCPACPR